jgi:hypothetical protein
VRRFAAALLLAAAFFPAAPALAWLDLRGSALSGDGGYRERTLDAALTVAPKWEWDDPETPWPFNAFLFRVGRAGYERDGAEGPTYRTGAAAGVRLFSRSSFEVAYAVTPELSESSGAYRGREWRVSAAAGWEGLLPRIDLEAPAFGRDFETRLTLGYGRTTHEERVQVSTRPLEWVGLREGYISFGLAETFRRATTVRVLLERRGYDGDLAGFFAAGDYFPLAATKASARPELLHGFVSGAWEAGIERFFGEHFKVSADFRRAKYEAGQAPEADTLRLRADVFLGLYFSAHGIHESFRPQGLAGSTFAGGGIGFHF